VSYIAGKIGHLVRLWQPHVGSLFQSWCLRMPMPFEQGLIPMPVPVQNSVQSARLRLFDQRLVCTPKPSRRASSPGAALRLRIRLPPWHPGRSQWPARPPCHNVIGGSLKLTDRPNDQDRQMDGQARGGRLDMNGMHWALLPQKMDFCPYLATINRILLKR
jgi:hypothetical protein